MLKANAHSSTYALAIAASALATWLTWLYHRQPVVGIDDANIFFAYAENLIRGDGFVYNPGGERVEGFTSFLWLLVVSAVFRAGFGEGAVTILTGALLAVSSVVLLWTVRQECREHDVEAWPYELLFLALTLSAPAYVTWSTITLLDTGVWAATVAIAAVVVVRLPTSRTGRVITAVLCALLPLIRPEAMLVGPFLIAVAFVRAMRASESPQRRITAVIGGLALLLSAGALLLFRLTYFDYPFPNTYYAKVSPSLSYNLQEGAGYLGRFLRSSTIVGLSVLVACWFAASRLAIEVGRLTMPRGEKPARAALTVPVCVSLVTLTLLLGPVLTGGDHFAMFRQFQPAYPLLCLMLVFGALRIRADRWLREGVAGVSVLLLALPTGYWLWAYAHDTSWSDLRNRVSPIQHEFDIAKDEIVKGRSLDELFASLEPRPVIGVIAAGGIRRGYSGPLLDLMGLNSVAIAHWPGDRRGIKNHAAFEPEAFLTLLPDIVLAPLPSVGDDFSVNVALKGILDDERFQGRYTYGALYPPAPGSGELTAFFKLSWLQRLIEWRFEPDDEWQQQWLGVHGSTGVRSAP